MKSCLKNRVFLILVIMAMGFTFNPTESLAQTLTQDIPLSFGRTVMRDNNSNYEIRLNTDGSYSADSVFVFFSPPVFGEYTVTGHTPLTELDITISEPSLSPTSGGAAIFDITSPFTRPSTVTTNALGEATFEVGATLRSDGSGNIPDNEGDYTASMIITVSEVP